MALIHPTALVDSTAELAADVEAGPYAIIEAGVRLGAGCRVEAHAQILEGTVMGERNLVGHAAVIGGAPQSTAFDRRIRSRVRIGNDNILREHVTVHRSVIEGGETVLGSGNFLMIDAHAGHDTIMGDHNVLANQVLLGGHVRIGSRCFLGGGALFHQFVRVGDFVMVQGNASLSKDVPPFAMSSGLNRVCGLNIVGMRRAGLSSEVRLAVKRAFVAVLRGRGSAVQTAQQLLDQGGLLDEVRGFLEFILAPSHKGVSYWRSRRDEED